MIKCKQAMESSACGKVCCCLECEEKETCKDVCSYMADAAAGTCEDVVTEEAALATMKETVATTITAITELVKQKKKIEDQEKAMKEQLQKAMEKYGVKKFENAAVSFTYIAPTVSNTIDSKALKADLPDVAAKYTKPTPKAGYVKVTVK